MTFPALPFNSPLMNELLQAKERLLSVRATLLQACRDVEAQLGALDSLCAAAPAAETSAMPPPTSLFECPPVNVQLAPAADFVPASSLVIKAAAPAALDPQLEQATLEELNSALSKAFAHIAGRPQW
ncbi:MAG: hypothetical protein U0984_10560 [Prosthecobacter sp.]|nr:hypothetical protein [Prosthecobacter sp.]